MAYPGGPTARLVCVGLATLVVLGAAPSSGNGPLVTGQLEIHGNRLTIHPDDAYPVVNVGERRRARTCYGGATDECGAVVAGDPRIASSYAIRLTFTGEDTRGQPLSEPRVMINEGAAAFLQNDERVVIVRYRNPVSALTYFSGEPVVAHEHLRLDVRDAGGAFAFAGSTARKMDR